MARNVANRRRQVLIDDAAIDEGQSGTGGPRSVHHNLPVGLRRGALETGNHDTSHVSGDIRAFDLAAINIFPPRQDVKTHPLLQNSYQENS